MNEGPIGPPGETPPAPETPPTPPAQQPASWSVVPYEKETPPAGAAEPSPYTPPPADYTPTPGYAPPPAVAARPPRNMGPIIAVVAVVALVVVAVIGYAAAGYAFANSRIDKARSTYNTVVSHQNAITDNFNSFDTKVAAVNLSTVTSAQLKQNRSAYDQLVSQSQAAQPTITADDASLAAAQSSLTENSWLTVFSRSSLDQVSTKIGHERNALGSAKTITADLVQLGTFYQSFYDSLIDLDTVSTKAQATDFAGAKTATATLKTDIAKALQLSTAPGLPPEMKAFLTDYQSLALDFEKLLNAAIAGDASAAQTALNAFDADVTKVDAYDFDKMSTEIKNFYQPLIDAFNSEVNKANSM